MKKTKVSSQLMPKPLGSLVKARRWLKIFIYANASILSCALPIQASTSATIIELADNPVGFQFQAGDFAVVFPTSDADIYALSNNKRKAVTACTDDDDDDGNCNTLGDSSSRSVNLSLTGPFADFLPASDLYVARTLLSYCANSNANIYSNRGNIDPSLSFYSSSVLMAENMQYNLNEVNLTRFLYVDAILEIYSL
jgi:MSHA biogenesis protein MshO